MFFNLLVEHCKKEGVTMKEWKMDAGNGVYGYHIALINDQNVKIQASVTMLGYEYLAQQMISYLLRYGLRAFDRETDQERIPTFSDFKIEL
jgi:hypothetical protein